jgi:hypothetical protein
MWKQYASAGTEYAQKLLMNQAGLCLWEDFYEQYDPQLYQREYNILSNSYYPYKYSTMGMNTTFESGVIVSSDNMFPYSNDTFVIKQKNDKSLDNSEIAERVWLEGMHGREQTLPTPADTLADFVNSRKFWTIIDNYASSKIK